MGEPSLDDRLALSRWGLRFLHGDTETEFREWHARSVIAMIPVAVITSIVGLSAAIGVISVVPARHVQLAYWVIAFNIAFVAACQLVARRPAAAARALGLFLLTNTTAGLSCVAISFWCLDRPELSMASVAIIVSFFYLLRHRPRNMLLAGLPYLVLHEALLVAEARSGKLAIAATWGYAIMPGIAVGIAVVACAMFDVVSRRSFVQERIIDEQRRAIDRERARADEERARADALLHSILPPAIADRLKRAPEVIADRFDEVTVLFADVVGFTPLAAELGPEKLVEILNRLFTRFDALAERHGVEKIKTIGDAYMAVAGLPTPRPDHAQAVASLALEMRAAVDDLARQDGHPLRVRIGVASGPVVAGVIGARKFAYDLWGDTVNTAARMESHGVPGEIQVAEATWARLRGGFVLRERGLVEVKGKGAMRTWMLDGRLEAVPGVREETG